MQSVGSAGEETHGIRLLIVAYRMLVHSSAKASREVLIACTEMLWLLKPIVAAVQHAHAKYTVCSRGPPLCSFIIYSKVKSRTEKKIELRMCVSGCDTRVPILFPFVLGCSQQGSLEMFLAGEAPFIHQSGAFLSL